MPVQLAADQLYEYVLGRISGARFESFAKKVFGLLFGEQFGPLGGIHDGGADGLLSSYVQEDGAKPNTFVQFSTTEDDGTKSKITDTIDALRKVGRNPRQLIYATSRALPKADIIAQNVFDSHGVTVSIRDFERIKGYVNSDARTNAAFYEFFADDINTLTRAANLHIARVSNFATDPTVYVFLNHELRDRFSRDHLNDRVVDSLIYWALRDTDPDAGRLMSRPEIVKRVAETFPTAKSVLLPRIDDRLAELVTKDSGGRERIRHYRADDLFSLPFEMRQQLAADASGAVLQQDAFRASIGSRLAAEIDLAADEKRATTACELIFTTVHRYFIEQGLVLAAFLERKLEQLHIEDQVIEDTMASALSEIQHGASVSPALFAGCLNVLRGIFYRSSPGEREYMSYLSRTSCLLVTLQCAPRLLEYLNQMGGNFRLLVGTDLLVKALSERYLEAEYQNVSNMLRVCRQLGAELILTEPVRNEVFTHLHAADLEFRNYYAAQEQYFKPEDIANCDRIMIRAYLYARRRPGGPNSWREFVNQLTDPDGLRNKSEQASQALQGFLLQRFSMEYIAQADLEASVPEAEVTELADRLAAARDAAHERKHEELSYNDALMVYVTYAQRRKQDEEAIYDGFGFRTWWLTKETRVLALTPEIVRKAGGVPYIMRPEFLLNFISLAPKASEVRKAFANLLPTTAGLQLGRHLKPEVMHSLLKDAEEWQKLTPERVGVMLSERANRLKFDRFKQYAAKV